MASKKPMGAAPVRGGRAGGRGGAAIPPRPSRKAIDAVIEEVLEDCFGEDEELAAWTERLTEELDLPFKALLVPDSGRRNAPPRPVEVLDVSEGDDGGPIAEVKLSNGTEVPVRLRDLIPLDAAEDTTLLMYAYRDWVQGRDLDDDFDEDDVEDEEEEDWADEDDLDLDDEVPDILADDDLGAFPVLDEDVVDVDDDAGLDVDDEAEPEDEVEEEDDIEDEEEEEDLPRRPTKAKASPKAAAKPANSKTAGKKATAKEEKPAKSSSRKTAAAKEEKSEAKKPAPKKKPATRKAKS